MKKDPILFLQHILESIEAIESYTKDLPSEESFLKDQETQDSVMRRLEIIGEAITNLPEETKSRSLEVAWKNIVAMRNILIHEYFGVDLSLVWRVINKDLPPFKDRVNQLLATLH